MLVSLNEVLKFAEKKSIAIGAFNVPNWESAQAICDAAEETEKPVILNYAPVHAPFMSMEDAAEIMLYFAKKCKQKVVVHLDHGTDFDCCMKAIRLGFTSVMIDASASSFEENIETTKAVVRASHAVGVDVEAEVGHIFASATGVGKNPKKIETKDSFSNIEDVYTQPEKAREFKKATDVDALAIAFGTSHGLYLTKPVLDLERITQIRKAVKMPFVMHGGSGLTKKEFQTAIKNGIRKINYYTYMTLAGGDAVKQALLKSEKNAVAGDKNQKENVFFHDIPVIASKAMKDNVVEAIRIFSNEI
ncbi:MAG: class II fructose-bisphosphate aldolase [Treponema sp.]|nr:class II fructose-bisphosphate aldolase [Treponema sp.]